MTDLYLITKNGSNWMFPIWVPLKFRGATEQDSRPIGTIILIESEQ